MKKENLLLDLDLDLRTKSQVVALVCTGALPQEPTSEDFINVKRGLKGTAIYRNIKREIKKLS
jgi:hypothetical protein